MRTGGRFKTRQRFKPRQALDKGVQPIRQWTARGRLVVSSQPASNRHLCFWKPSQSLVPEKCTSVGHGKSSSIRSAPPSVDNSPPGRTFHRSAMARLQPANLKKTRCVSNLPMAASDLPLAESDLPLAESDLPMAESALNK